MAEKYFNRLQFLKMIELMEIDPLESKRQFIRYLREYPYDFSAYSYFSSLLVSLGEIDEAIKIIDKANELIKLTRFDNNKRYKYFRAQELFSKLRILSYQEKYFELYELINNNRDLMEDMEIRQVEYNCKCKLGLINSEFKRKNSSYSLRQMREYQEDDFLDHIRKHMADCIDDYKEPNQSLFRTNFPIYEVIKEIKKYIPSDKKLFRGFLTDIYSFKYNECGRDNNRITDYFHVVCFHNTSNILTMCPVSNCGYIPYVDLNYMIRTNKDTKIKRKSQIDKFNARYNK